MSQINGYTKNSVKKTTVEKTESPEVNEFVREGSYTPNNKRLIGYNRK